MPKPILALALAALAGCAVYQGSGTSAEETRDLSDFDSVSNTLFADTQVTSGAEGYAVTVTCDDNLLEHLLTTVEDGELVINTEPMINLNPQTDCVVVVELPSLVEVHSSGSGGVDSVGPAPDLSKVSNSGSGPVSVVDVDCTSLESHNSGSGGIALAGSCEEADLENSGSGGVEAMELTAAGAELNNSASGDISLTVDGEVIARVSGSGSIHLYGNPQVVEQSETGSGSVIIED